MRTDSIQYNGSADRNFRMNPVVFNMWIFLATIVMTFAGLTSAYIVRRSDGDWWTFPLPEAFLFTTVIIILSSLTLHWAYHNAKREQPARVKQGLWLTFLLGTIFGIGQVMGWNYLTGEGIYLAGNPNPAGSFLFVISGLHLLHIAGGLIFLGATIYSAYKNRIHKQNLLRIKLCTTFWHFLGGLWIYLYIFLMIYR